MADELRAPHTVAPHGSNVASDRRTRGLHGRAAAETADCRQAAYFLRLLCQSRLLSDDRINKYSRAVASFEAKGDAEGAAGFRRRLRTEERDRQVVDRMIENLHRRFPLQTPDEVRRKALLAVR
jgi:hypothetical protein